MLGNLRQKTGELHALNADLEQRVEQRTAELREAFERVRANEQRTQTIIEAAQDPFIAIDLQGRAREAFNRRAVLDVGVNHLLQLRGERRVVGAR